MPIEGFLVLAAVGALAGFLAGLLGIGGGLLMVPFISYYLAAQGVGAALGVKMAIATAMATILITSISSVRAHHRLGKVRWPVALSLVPGVWLGSMVASVWIFSTIKGGVLAVVQREIVEKKRWLTPEEFVEDWAVAQTMPGPNVINLAIMIGDRHFGLRGALAALVGVMAAPMLISHEVSVALTVTV